MKLAVVAVALAALVPFSAASSKYCCPKTHSELVCNCRLTNLMASKERAELCDYSKNAKTCTKSKTSNFCCKEVEKSGWLATQARYNADSCVKAVTC